MEVNTFGKHAKQRRVVECFQNYTWGLDLCSYQQMISTHFGVWNNKALSGFASLVRYYSKWNATPNLSQTRIICTLAVDRSSNGAFYIYHFCRKIQTALHLIDNNMNICCICGHDNKHWSEDFYVQKFSDFTHVAFCLNPIQRCVSGRCSHARFRTSRQHDRGSAVSSKRKSVIELYQSDVRSISSELFRARPELVVAVRARQGLGFKMT